LMGLESKGEGREIVENKFGDWHCWDRQVVSMGK